MVGCAQSSQSAIDSAVKGTLAAQNTINTAVAQTLIVQKSIGTAVAQTLSAGSTATPAPTSTRRPPTAVPVSSSSHKDVTDILLAHGFMRDPTFDENLNYQKEAWRKGTDLLVALGEDDFGISSPADSSEAIIRDMFSLVEDIFGYEVTDAITGAAADGKLEAQGTVGRYHWNYGPSDDYSLFILVISPLP